MAEHLQELAASRKMWVASLNEEDKAKLQAYTEVQNAQSEEVKAEFVATW